MNTSRKPLLLIAMFMVGATAFLGGCGPENLDDPTYLADIDSSDSVKEDDPMNPNPNMPNSMDPNNPNRPNGMMKPALPGPNGAVAPVIELPPVYGKAPPVVTAQPPVLTNTGEVRPIHQNVLIERDIHVLQPAQNTHNIHYPKRTDTQTRDNFILHPTTQNNVVITGSASATAAVLPPTTVVAPTVALPGVVTALPAIGIAPIAPVAPFCAPYLSGGMLRACGPLGYGGFGP